MFSGKTNEMEYKYLRDCILQKERMCIQIITLSIAATGVILSIAVNNGNSLYYLLPWIVLMPATFLYVSKVCEITSLTTYISVFVENDDEGLIYEKRFHKCHKTFLDNKMNNKLKKYWHWFQRYICSTIISFHMICLICLFLWLGISPINIKTIINCKTICTCFCSLPTYILIIYVIFTGWNLYRFRKGKFHDEFWGIGDNCKNDPSKTDTR